MFKTERAGLLTAVVISLGLSAGPSVASEAEAKQLLRNMSDYLSRLESFSFAYDSTLEVVTTDHQKIGLAASGEVAVRRPDNLSVTRTGGFTDLEMAYDGASLTMHAKHANTFTVLDAPGSVDALIDMLRDEHGRPVPAADLITHDPYNVLM
ncbi:MAG: DUF2092 domain-containing protein, partial [Roseobacter sp.]|nr:DUF2092 domain-containing protein [Roseobacter sp.]